MDDFTKDTDITKENPATNGACLTTVICNDTPKPKKGQRKNGFSIQVTIYSDEPTDAPLVLIVSGKPARSLLCLYQSESGLTRIESLSKYGILCLTQHVSKMRHKWGLEVLTERVQPTGYGIYHLITPVSIRILSQGGQ